MTSKTLTGTYAAGYAITPPVTNLSIATTGYVGGSGVASPWNGAGSYTVVNDGKVKASGVGVYLYSGGSVTNGGSSDTVASITGVLGVSFSFHAGTVANFGTISDLGTLVGVNLGRGGMVTNGSAADTTALIKGAEAVAAYVAPATIVNYGTFLGTSVSLNGAVVYLGDGGSVTNGDATHTGATVAGSGAGTSVYGIRSKNVAATVANFGSIVIQSGSGGGVGVDLQAGGQVTNGSTADNTALIQGSVEMYGPGTVTNYGSISGGIKFGHDATIYHLLRVEAGSSVSGVVLGSLGTLDLASGVGTISSISVPYGVVLAGATAGSFKAFGTLEVGTGASFTLSGVGTITPVVSAPPMTVDLDGTLVVTGTLFTTGKITGGGVMILQSGTATFSSGSSVTVANVSLTGGDAVANVNTNLSYHGTWTQAAGTLSIGDTDTFTLTGAGSSFAGTIAGSQAAVVFSGGAETLAGTTLTVAHLTAIGATVSLSGSIDNHSAFAVHGGELLVAASGLTLTGTGRVVLNNSAANRITGVTSTATLTLGQKLTGAGMLGAGNMALTVSAAGVIQSAGSHLLTIDTGANTIANAGRILAESAGGLTIDSAVDNTGRLVAQTGTLTVNGVVTGTGYGQVGGGTLKLTASSSFNQNVAFVGTGGTLELAHGRTYAGRIRGFSTAANTFLDLDDIAFGATTTASYSGTSSGGVLTVSDGTNTAHIHFSGNYLNSGWAVSTDGHGGTRIVDPARSAPAGVFVQTVAGFASRPPPSIGHDSAINHPPPPFLASPRVRLA